MNRPALRFALLLAAGILAGLVLPLPATMAFALCAGALAAYVMLSLWVSLSSRRGRQVDPGRQSGPGRSVALVRWAGPVLALSVFFLGYARYLAAVPDPPSGTGESGRASASGLRPGDTVSVRGWVDDAPKSGRFGVRFLLNPVEPDERAGGGRFLVSIPLAARAGEGTQASAPEMGAAPETETAILSALLPGRLVSVTGVFLGPTAARNPGDPDWSAWYRLNGIRGRIRTAGAGEVGVADEFRFPDRYVSPVRERLGVILERFAPGQPGLLLRGLILGERSRIPEERQADYITVGVMHMLAISGQQVVLVAAILTILVSFLPRWVKFTLVSAALGYYVLLTGSAPSVTRAALMAVLVLASRNLERKSDIANSLGAAAMLILLFDPTQLFDPGFVLSFGAVIALVALYGPIEGLLKGRLHRYLVPVWQAAALTLAAGIGTAPVMAYYFGKVSLIGFFANCLVVPLSSLALLLGVALLAAAGFSGWLAGVYGAAAVAVCETIFALVERFADVPAAMVDFRLDATGLAVVCLVGALLLRRRLWKYAIIVVLVALNVMTVRALLAPDGRVSLTFIDVGQGDAALFRSPDGRSLLFDVGLPGRGGRAGPVAGVAAALGVGEVDAVVISHPHADHMGGAGQLLRALRVGRLYGSGAEPASEFYRAAAALADSLKIARTAARAGEILMAGPVRVYVLHPPRHADLSDLNNSSVVLKLVYGSTSAIFTGDIEAEAERELARHYGDFLKADILKVAHHGSRTSSTDPFLDLVRPSWAVVSVGESNRYGHPSADVIARLSAGGAVVVRTDSSGAVVLESDGSAVVREEWRW